MTLNGFLPPVMVFFLGSQKTMDPPLFGPNLDFLALPCGSACRHGFAVRDSPENGVDHGSHHASTHTYARVEVDILGHHSSNDVLTARHTVH